MKLNRECIKNRKMTGRYLVEATFLFLLFVYPLRHVNQGLDIWDTGYNYANFQYMGLAHMDSMWLFSTYLANLVGHFFTLLPFGKTLIGLNVYTGLIVSALALLGYSFATRKLEIPKVVVFTGEMLAISLCWCPTAKLYDYLTYLLFLAGTIFLYLGLTGEKKKFLFLAGVCLGTNILVRFSNIPEMGLIVAVWGYAFWKEKDCPEKDSFNEDTKRTDCTKEYFSRIWKSLSNRTLWCLFGYVSALAVWFLWIGIRYGLSHYVNGVMRLFAMTETATDYQAGSMLLGAVYPYIDLCKYYFPRMMVFMTVAVLAWWLGELFVTLRPQSKVMWGVKQSLRVASVGFLMGMIAWLYERQYCSFLFYSYDSMYRPAVLFMLSALGISGLNLVRKKADKKEKLLSLMVILILLLTSLGSNNNVYPSINNLFLVAPYILWQCVRFTKWSWKKTRKAVPVAVCMWVLLAMLFVQAGGFGLHFVFMDSTGAREFDYQVENNTVLSGVGMSALRAGWLQQATDYVNQNNLGGREAIPFGYIPSACFYLQLPPAFNSWSDLASYGYATMEQDLEELKDEMALKEEVRPVILLEHTYHLLALGDKDSLLAEGMDENWLGVLEANPKWILLKEFMEEYDYHPTFDSVKMAIWE